MTVRRYSMGSGLSSGSVRDGRKERVRTADSGWGSLQEEIQHGSSIFGGSSRVEAGKPNNRHSFQDYVNKNRYEVSHSINVQHSKPITWMCFILQGQSKDCHFPPSCG